MGLLKTKLIENASKEVCEIPVLCSVAHKTLQEQIVEILRQMKVFSVNPFYSLTLFLTMQRRCGLAVKAPV